MPTIMNGIPSQYLKAKYMSTALSRYQDAELSIDDIFDDDKYMWEKVKDVIVTKYLVKQNNKNIRIIIDKNDFDNFNVGDTTNINNEEYVVHGTGYEIHKHRFTGETKENEKIYDYSPYCYFDF